MTTTASHQTAELVTRESALEAIQHVAQSNTLGRTIQAARMLVAAQARATGTQGASELLPLPIALSTVQVFRLSIVEAAIPAEFIYSDKQMLEYGQQCYQLALQRKGEPAEGGAFPERDPSKPAEQQGLFRKFDVRRVDGSDQPGGKHHGCHYYVLDLNHDQHAPAAMRAYAAACRATHPHLADDIEAEFGAAPQASREVPEGDKQAVIALFEQHISANPQAFLRPGETVYQITQKEMLAFAAALAAPSPASAEDGEERDAFDAHYQKTRGMSEPPTRCGAGYVNGYAQEAWTDWRAALAAQLDGSQKAGGAA